MSDRLYLSLWLKRQPQARGVRPFEELLTVFPFSRLGPMLQLTVRAVSTREAPLFEENFAGPDDLPRLVEALDAWITPDLSIEVEAAWDLLQPDQGEWKLAPARVSLLSYGPDFDREYDEDLRIEFGRESLFLPENDAPGSFRLAESNIRSLLKLVNDVEQRLTLEKRLLWTEGGGNFAARLESLVRQQGH